MSGLSLSGPDDAALPEGGVSDFGVVVSGQPAGLVFTLSNTGLTTLSLSSITADDPRFTISTPPGTEILEPAQSLEFSVTFSPSSAGVKFSLLRISGGR